MTFTPGDWIDLREVWDGRTWELRRGIVVRDDPDVIAIYTPPETPVQIAVDEHGRRLRVPRTQWSLADSKTPVNKGYFAIHPPGASHSVLLGWDENWRFPHWYINLESDLQRTERGFEYEEHILDILVLPDLTAWLWKDEDELRKAVSLGLFTQFQAGRFYEEGRGALERLTSRKPPYDEPWEDWRPPADWLTPK